MVLEMLEVVVLDHTQEDPVEQEEAPQVVLQELDHWNKLLYTMSGALNTLLRALKGEVGMSAMLESLASSLLIGMLPASWVKLTPQTEKPLGI